METRVLCVSAPSSAHTPVDAGRGSCSRVSPSEHVALDARGNQAGHTPAKAGRDPRVGVSLCALLFARLHGQSRPLQHVWRAVHRYTGLWQLLLEYVGVHRYTGLDQFPLEHAPAPRPAVLGTMCPRDGTPLRSPRSIITGVFSEPPTSRIHCNLSCSGVPSFGPIAVDAGGRGGAHTPILQWKPA